MNRQIAFENNYTSSVESENIIDKDKDKEDDDIEELDYEKSQRQYLIKMKDLTRRSTSLVLNLYTSFIIQFPSGRMDRDQFFNKVIGNLIDQNESGDLLNNKAKEEKIQICSRLFDICDQNEDGKVDFIEYFTLFWSRSEGSTYEKLTLIFEMFDLNNNGWIDFNELHTIVKALLKLKYSMADEDNRKEIDSQLFEFQELIFKDCVITNFKLPLSYNVAMYIMRKLDSTHNARLTKSEFVDGCLNCENIRKFLSPLNNCV